ncbi:hypothetical protein CL614_08615 [archaeon]|nr:hypothetical protein [archaeon]|tara:strand:- start:138 stop:539 length:402 start_codon:yes stop_codon:yes gene_type:complete
MKLNEILLESLGIPFPNKCHLTIINGNGDEISVDCEVASTNEEKAQGLMYRDNLGKNNGMFFDSIDNGFWMKDVDIPLEMIFIDGDEISEILPANPNDTTNISNNLPADSNLEVNQGFCENNGIEVGDKIYKS